MNDKVVGINGESVNHENYASTNDLLAEIKEAGFDQIVCIGISGNKQAVVANVANQQELIASLEIAKTAVIHNIMNGG